MAATREIVKKVKNAILYSDSTIRIDNVRASYPHLTIPYMSDDDKAKKGVKDRNAYQSHEDYIRALLSAGAKYALAGMLPKNTHEEAKSLLVSVIDDIQKKNDVKIAKAMKFITNGDDSAKTEYEDHWIISSRESRRPSVRDRRGNVLITEREIEDTVYAGCFVNMLILPWLQDNQYGKRINAGLVAVQFAGNGDPFGNGRISDDDVFDAVDDDDGMGDSSSGDDDDL